MKNSGECLSLILLKTRRGRIKAKGITRMGKSDQAVWDSLTLWLLRGSVLGGHAAGMAGVGMKTQLATQGHRGRKI